jgi:hypothetical protein
MAYWPPVLAVAQTNTNPPNTDTNFLATIVVVLALIIALAMFWSGIIRGTTTPVVVYPPTQPSVIQPPPSRIAAPSVQQPLVTPTTQAVNPIPDPVQRPTALKYVEFRYGNDLAGTIACKIAKPLFYCLGKLENMGSEPGNFQFGVAPNHGFILVGGEQRSMKDEDVSGMKNWVATLSPRQPVDFVIDFPDPGTRAETITVDMGINWREEGDRGVNIPNLPLSQ